MGLTVSDLKPSPNPVYGFTGGFVTPMGVISHPMTMGDYPRQSCVMIDFLVINKLSDFNVVLSKPPFRALKVITSVYHLLMKFPTPNDMGQVHGNQNEARECYNQANRNVSRPRQVNIVDQWPPSEGPLDDTIDPRSPNEEAITRPIEDLVDLSLDDKELSKVLKLGKNLSDEPREAISAFLKQNLDMFAWTHSDMEGIDPEIMCHRLDIDSHRKPVRQK